MNATKPCPITPLSCILYASQCRYRPSRKMRRYFVIFRDFLDWYAWLQGSEPYRSSWRPSTPHCIGYYPSRHHVAWKKTLKSSSSTLTLSIFWNREAVLDTMRKTKVPLMVNLPPACLPPLSPPFFFTLVNCFLSPLKGGVTMKKKLCDVHMLNP